MEFKKYTAEDIVNECYSHGWNIFAQNNDKANPFDSEQIYINTSETERYDALVMVEKYAPNMIWTKVQPSEKYIPSFHPYELAETAYQNKVNMFDQFAKYGCE